jgi:hypothetical protein
VRVRMNEALAREWKATAGIWLPGEAWRWGEKE